MPSKYAHLLDNIASVAGSASDTPDTPLIALPGTQAIIAGGGIHYDGALMDQVPTLQVISRTGIGLDNVSISGATARGIAVCYAPDAPTISTAEHTIALLLAVAKRLKWTDQALRCSEKINFRSEYNGLELYERRLGLIGMGRIGSRVAKIALALGMSVVGFDPFISAERANELGVELAPTLEAVLHTADIVSLHLPLTPETRGLINAERLAQMKPGAILINAARGGLVDEAALFDALESGHLWGAGLDVFTSEPPSADHPLLARDDVIATPHIASGTGVGQDRLWHTAITQALQVLRGERPPHLVNPEVWPLDK